MPLDKAKLNEVSKLLYDLGVDHAVLLYNDSFSVIKIKKGIK